MRDGGFIDAYLHTFGLATGSDLSQLVGHSGASFRTKTLNFVSQQVRTAVPSTGCQPDTTGFESYIVINPRSKEK